MLTIAINLLRIVNKDYISLTLVFCLMPDFAYSVSWFTHLPGICEERGGIGDTIIAKQQYFLALEISGSICGCQCVVKWTEKLDL